jgi:hypothetical protein
MNDGPSGSLNKVSLAGGPLVFFAVVDGPRAMALDETSVYIASANAISVTGKRTGPVRTLVSPAVAQGLAVDESFVYWAGAFDGVRKVPIGGGSAIVMAEAETARDVAVDAACVYWVTSAGSVWRTAK